MLSLTGETYIFLIMDNILNEIEYVFNENRNVDIAAGQKAYMKNRSEFFGIKSPERRELQKPFLAKNSLPLKKDLEQLVKSLWDKPQREFQYFAMELLFKYKKQFEEKDIELFEFMVVNKSWWDSIDFISPSLMGEYFKMYPGNRNEYVEKWLASGNIWLQRSAVLFQLKYKDGLDNELLTMIIEKLQGSREFFINKAIGWILREYGKVNSHWVVEFCDKTELAPLSRKEALRIIIKK